MTHRNVLACLVMIACAGPLAAAQKELKETRRFPATAGKRILVDTSSLNVRLRGADVRDIEVTTELRIGGVSEEKATAWIEEHTPGFEDSTERLEILARPRRQGFLWLGHLTARARLRIVAPLDLVPDITTTSGDVMVRGDFHSARPLQLRTATGHIELVGAAGSVDFRSASGDIRIELVRALDHLFARTSSGDVDLVGGAREVHADTASGDVRMSNLSGSTEVATSSGKVVLRWDRLDKDATVTVRTATGRVDLVLPDSARPRGTLTTTGGTIRSDFPGTVNEDGDTVTLSGDGPTLHVETASGEIIVGYGDDWFVAGDDGAQTGS